MRRTHRIAAAISIGATALALSSCGSSTSSTVQDPAATSPASTSPSATSPSASTSATAAQYPNYKACLVSDTGGFNDHSFNENSLAGLTAAGTDYGVKTAKVQSDADSDYADNLATLESEKCDEITSVGFLLATDT